MFGEAVKEFCAKHEVAITDIDLIGSHGQTIWLLSRPKETEIRSAFCLGEGTVIVNRDPLISVSKADIPVGRDWNNRRDRLSYGRASRRATRGSFSSPHRWSATPASHQMANLPKHWRNSESLRYPS
jgi:hypothetical protein